MPTPLWRCPDCDTECRCEPLGSDDWGIEEDEEPVVIGPDCPQCGDEMAFVPESEDDHAH